jgi:hypothetical protein
MRACRSPAIITATSVVSPDRADRYAASGSSIWAVCSRTPASSVSGMADSSAMLWPAKVTASASGRSPVPWHTGQGTVWTNCSARWRMAALFELASVCITWRSALEKVPL